MLPNVTFLTMDLYEWCITVGVILAFVVFRLYADKKALSARLQNTVLLIGLVSIVGGYLFAVLFQAVYNAIASGTFVLNNGTGSTFYGGLIGGAAIFLTLYFTVGKKICGNQVLVQFSTVANIAVCAIAVAHAIGRLGCFFAGCCHGGETQSPIGIYMPAVGKTVIPTQLFEVVFLLCLFAVLSLFLFKTKINGLATYLTAYGVFRFIVEFWRGDDRGELVFFLSPSQFWSVVLVLVGIGIFVTVYLFRNRTPVEVVAALIFREGEFLICQRPKGKKRALLWEFVGGKVESGEDKETALFREVKEELGGKIADVSYFAETTYCYFDVTVHLTVFTATLAGDITAYEHNALAWIPPSRIKEYRFCPADEEILEKIKKAFSGSQTEERA
ncbi:MAG: prolipoprotein diacylglyceryl transferase [Clostridia bacterium]|nr:prolipoprotein diacylglyceryl transferase [Clostridia bacterium]